MSEYFIVLRSVARLLLSSVYLRLDEYKPKPMVEGRRLLRIYVREGYNHQY